MSHSDSSVANSGSPMPSPRKNHAVRLFSGLADDYDRVGAVMSFGQDPRWRRALVDAVAPATGDADSRRRHGHRHGRLRARRTRRGGRRARPERGDARQAPGLGCCERPSWRAGSHSCGERPRRCRSPTRSSTRCRSPICCGTSMTRQRRCGAGARGETGRTDRRWSSSASRAIPSLRWLWRIHTRIGLPLLGRAVSREWYEVGRFLGPNIEQFHAAQPDLPALWRGAGIADATPAQHELRRRHRRDGGPRRRRTSHKPARRRGPRSTRCRPAAGATSSRSCIRPTPRGI